MPPWRTGSRPGLGGEIHQLYTPTSGAFLALGREGLFRSDDGGATWAQLRSGFPSSITDLALGIDGANLDATTAGQDDQGVYRLHLR